VVHNGCPGVAHFSKTIGRHLNAPATIKGESSVFKADAMLCAVRLPLLLVPFEDHPS
jgi:hypothetical protein